MTDDDTQSDNGCAAPWPKTKAKAIKRSPQTIWEATKTTEEIDPKHPDIPPDYPHDCPPSDYQWRKALKPPSEQHKPGLPNIGLGPFDKPLTYWQLFKRLSDEDAKETL